MPYKFNPFTGSFDDVNLSTGAQGPQGPAGATGATGPTGVVAATAPIAYNSGTQTVSTTMATNKLLGRSTAGTGVAEEITIGSGLSLTAGTLSSTGGGGGSGTPGGSTTQVQFNNAGAFGGDADLTWNSTTNVLGVTGDVNLSDGGTYTTTLQTITPTAARTISLPDATGTVALVAGSSGQVLWNNAGVNAGASTLTYDGSILTTSGRFINSYNATASSPAKAFTGTWFTGGTGTTTKPQVLIEPTGTTSTAWSTSGTGLGVNAASGFAGRLLDLQVNGTSQVRATSDGGVNLTKIAPSTGSVVTFHRSDFANTIIQMGLAGSATGYLQVGASIPLAWSSSNDAGGAADIGLIRSAAGVVKVTNGSSGDGTISGQHRLVGTAPATASSTGTAGDVRYDASYIYICTATDTWKRAALTTW